MLQNTFLYYLALTLVCFINVKCTPVTNYAVNITLQNATSWPGPINMGINTVRLDKSNFSNFRVLTLN